MDVPTARIAVLNGAQFIVSPHFDKNIAENLSDKTLNL